MKKTRAIIATLGLLLPSLAFAQAMLLGDAKHGQKLHEAKCVACHVQQYGGDGSGMYKRADRKVRSIEGLMARVAGCNRQVNAGFSTDDINDVVLYLNQTYYRF
jgi:cytochrome c2